MVCLCLSMSVRVKLVKPKLDDTISKSHIKKNTYRY